MATLFWFRITFVICLNPIHSINITMTTTMLTF